MSQLTIYSAVSDGENPPLPSLHTTDAAIVGEELSQRGIRFQQWPTHWELDATSSQEEILAAYSAEIAQVQADGGYQTVDAISLGPDHPQRAELRQKFLSEHTHSEDEVRFFVDGKGLFCLHIGDELLQVLCDCLLYTSPSPRDRTRSRMPSSA